MNSPKLFATTIIARLVSAYGYEAADLAELSLAELTRLLEQEARLSPPKEVQITRAGRVFIGEKYIKKAA